MQVGSFSESLSALKRLVESHLREKEQAAEMLKGYVTTITREVRFLRICMRACSMIVPNFGMTC